MTISKEAIDTLCRPIVGIENRTPLEVQDIMSDRIRSFLSTLPIAGEGKVKALEFASYRDSEGTAPRWKAEHSFGEYRIILNTRDMEYWSPQFGGLTGNVWTSLEAAKAAAQSDYETRILSALISSPGKDGGQEVEAVAFHVRIKGYGEELCFTEDGAQSLVKRLRRTKGQDGEATITPLYATTPKCSVCGGSGVEEVYGGHGTIMEVPCSICTAMPTTVERLTEVIRDTRALVAEAAATGFNWSDGDWAERLYANQAVLSFALSASQSTSTEGER